MTFTCTIKTPLGSMTAAAEDGALTGLWFNGQRYFPTGAGTWTLAPELPIFCALRRQLELYFSGKGFSTELALAPRGTSFQREVWQALREIPYGRTETYGDIAVKIAAARGIASMSAQAVGGAVGHNPLSILIPCHRVLGGNGTLTGYAGGLDRKAALLDLEKGT